MTGGLRVYWHDSCLGHEPPGGLFEAGPEPLLDRPEAHPENQQRIVNIRSVLRRGPLGPRVEFASPRPAGLEELCAFHESAHVERLERKLAGLAAPVQLDPQTWASPGTWSAALAAAGGAVAAARAVIRGEVDRAYALVRPPGHHAGRGRTDGFCVFNNTALAAAQCRLTGARRVAVVDFDVHHGNGTQAGFYADPNVLTLSIHMDHRSWGGNHPELGVPAEVGAGAAAGTNVNVALPFGCGDRAYASAFTRVVEPVIERFAPDVLVCAAGFDANQFDPTGRQCVSMSGFHDMGVRIRRLADRACGGRVVLCQEGGYARTYTAFCAYAFIAGLIGEELALDDPLAYLPDVEHAHAAAIDETLACLSRADELG